MSLQELMNIPAADYYPRLGGGYHPVFSSYKGKPCHENQFTSTKLIWQPPFQRSPSVYLAQYEDKKVVVKKYPCPWSDVDDLVEQLKWEELALHKFDHPNITKGICTFKDSAGNIHLAMEYSSENTLHSLLEFEEAGDPKNQRKFAQQMVDVLIYLDSLGVIHNDIRPENIIVDENWSIKLIDFALVCRPEKTHIAYGGYTLYWAPEQHRREKYNNGKDWYSFGLTLYELIRNGNPFKDLETKELKEAVLRGIPGLKDTDADHFIANLCRVEKEQRWCSANGNNQDILNHPFLKDPPLKDEVDTVKVPSEAQAHCEPVNDNEIQQQS